MRQRVVAALFRAGTGALRALPAPLAYGLADVASLGVVVVAWLHERRVAPLGRGLFRNQRIVFRERWTPREGRRLLFAWARHAARLVVDFARMPLVRPDSFERFLDPAPIRPLQQLARERGGLLCVSGHLGVWEMAGHAPSVLGTPVRIVVRPLGNPALDDAANAIRRSGGQIVVSKWGALYSLKKALDRGEIVGFLADEAPGERPVFAPFLGTVAATSPVAAFLHRATGKPIAVVSCHRTGRGRFAFHCWRLIDRAPTADADADLRAITEEINDALSEAILAHPEQWLWGSRRFLTRPPGERPGPDELPPACPRTPPSAAPATRAARAGLSAAGSR